MTQNRIFRRFAGLLLAGWLLLTGNAFAQSSATGTRDVLREITDVVGLKPRFELRATTEVQNAAAVVYGGKRYLLYNPEFVSAVNKAGRTDWAGISILAHEMGHHLNGHTLRAGGSQPADELEADEFSGFVLRKMGASLAEAQTAMAVISDDEGSETHPGRAPRLKSISDGWKRANDQIVASTHSTAPSAAPVALASRPAQPVAGSPVKVLGKITFRSNPDAQYYLINGLKVVRLDEDSSTVEVVGRLTRSTSASFPYILVDEQDNRLYVSARGGVFNNRGQQVALLSDPS
ncbi:membrane-binding protein [Hymenobacter sp. BT491]|uniref:membrane-binding protein n=1 Tax=Hymenobacter sp. BT491 TaxID=2766779 RepID=UPI001653C247|nr:membrane-binding protein [Hymenobacter sp. BT491]MBC6989522.1 membrane-binding protein [Hymenobacter sp. BT491]